MNFSDLLFPEILLNKRGPEPMRLFYKALLDEIQITPQGEVAISQTIRDFNDTNLIRHLNISKLCIHEKFKTYHVGANFLKVLSSLDRDIPVDLLPEEFCAYISFAKNQIKDDDGYVDGAFVYIGKKGSHFFRDEHRGKRALFITYINSLEQALTAPVPVSPLNGSLMLALDDFEEVREALSSHPTIDSALSRQWVVSEQEAAQRALIFRTVINTVLYIHSEDPKIERASPWHKGGTSKNEMRRRGHVINECTLPITFVHRLYTRERLFSVDSTFIDSFPRWQRCGVGLSRVKLVWVREHQRTYRKDSADGSLPAD